MYKGAPKNLEIVDTPGMRINIQFSILIFTNSFAYQLFVESFFFLQGMMAMLCSDHSHTPTQTSSSYV